MFSVRSLVRRSKAAFLSRASRGHGIAPVSIHDLTMNRNLSADEHAYCVSLVDAIQALYDEAPAYITRNALDSALFLPGNEWAGIVPVTGLKFRTTYKFINFLRLHALCLYASRVPGVSKMRSWDHSGNKGLSDLPRPHDCTSDIAGAILTAR